MAYGTALEEHRLWMPSCCFPSDLLQLTSVTQKRAYLYFMIYVTATKRTPLQVARAWGGQWGCIFSPIGPFISAHFRKLVPEGLALVSLTLNAELLPFGTLTGFGTSLTVRRY